MNPDSLRSFTDFLSTTTVQVKFESFIVNLLLTALHEGMRMV